VPSIALTFDDGPSRWTEPLLDVLAKHGAQGTFFVVGSIASARADLLRRMVDEGHEVGNHTWSHPALARDCDDERVRSELQRTTNLLIELAGVRPTLFRAPHYDVDERVEAIAAEVGLRHVRGDIAPPDWHPGWTARLSITFVLQQIHGGSIVGLHDGVPPTEAEEGLSRQLTVDAVAGIVPALQERGIDCVAASELLDTA